MKIAPRSTISRSFVRICLAAGTLAMSACGSDSGSPALQVRSGALAMPLTTTVNASTYRLDTSLYIYGPVFTVASTTSDPGENVLRIALQTGQYSASLSGWTLEKQQADGSFAPVQATLVSNPSLASASRTARPPPFHSSSRRTASASRLVRAICS